MSFSILILPIVGVVIGQDSLATTMAFPLLVTVASVLLKFIELVELDSSKIIITSPSNHTPSFGPCSSSPSSEPKSDMVIKFKTKTLETNNKITIATSNLSLSEKFKIGHLTC